MNDYKVKKTQEICIQRCVPGQGQFADVGKQNTHPLA